MTNPIVTVIIPAKDRVKLVKKAIRSVLNQSLSDPVEIILVDDCSRPALKTSLGSLSNKINIVRHSNSKGPSISRNSGLKIAKGKYIAFLDSDDTWKKSFLAVSIETLKKTHLAGTLSLSNKIYSSNIPAIQKTKLYLFNLAKDTLLLTFFIFNKGRLPQSAPYLTQLSHMLFDIKSLKGLSFNTDLDYCEDWDFVLNILKKDDLLIIPQRLLQFNYSASSLSFTKKSIEKNRYYLKHIETLKKLYKNSFYVILFQIYTKYFLIGKK